MGVHDVGVPVLSSPLGLIGRMKWFEMPQERETRRKIGVPLRQRIWTRHEGGSSVGPYTIETIGPNLSVLSLDGDLGPTILTSAASPTELEAFQAMHARATGKLRPLVLALVYIIALAGMVAGSIIGEIAGAVCLGAAVVLTIGSIVSMSEYAARRRVVRAHIPA